MMHRRVRNSRGYSLAELMTIVAIIGIVSMVGLPALMQLMPQYRIKSAASDMAASLRLTRERAVSTRRDWQMVVNASDATPPNQYKLQEVVNGTATDAGFDGRLLPPGAQAWRTLSGGAYIMSGSTATVVFQRDGTAASTANIVLAVDSNWVRYNRYTITVEASGRVKIAATKV